MQRLFRFSVAIVAAAVAVATLAVTAPAAQAGTADAEGDFVHRINALRASKGLAPLSVDAELVAVARNWAAHMASVGDISHNPDLGSQVHQPWTMLGENVGMGPNVTALHDAFVASPGHYANLVEPGYTHIGVGVVIAGDGTMFTAHQFMTLTEAASAAAPAPTTHPAPHADPPAPAPSDQSAAPPASEAPAATAPPPAPTPPERVPVAASGGVSRIPSVLHGLRVLDGMR